MRIAIFDGSFETTAFIRRLIRGLVDAGHEVYVLGFNEQLQEDISGVDYVPLGSSRSKLNFIQTSLSYGIKSGELLSIIKYLLNGNKKQVKQLNLSYVLNSIQPDVIHLQWVSNIKLFEDFLPDKRYKFVLSQRGYQTNVRPFVDTDNFNYLQQWLPYFSGFHSVSHAISNKGDQIYHSKDKLDQVVYTGLDLSKFEFKSQVIKNKAMQIISVGRPHWKKGYDYAIKACCLLKQKGLDFCYTLIGARGNEELLFLINELALQNQVTLMDKSPQSKVFELMHTSDLFLLPSLEEGIANVAVEAMALGTPVISTDCGGMQELITHKKEGWIVPKRDANAMANQILEISQMDVNEICKVKENARLKVKKQHTEEQMVEGMTKLYNKIINEATLF